jgi:hypothetical protein
MLPQEYAETTALPVRFQEFEARELWSAVKFAYNPYLVEEERVNRKMEVYRKLSRIGLAIARGMEDALLEACLRISKNVTKNVFKSSLPDLIIQDKKLIVEISTRFENPVDREYVKKKMEKVPENFDLLIIAPEFSESVWKKYRTRIVPGVYLEKMPVKGFPIFKEYSAYAGDFAVFERKVSVVSREEITNWIEKVVREYAK